MNDAEQPQLITTLVVWSRYRVHALGKRAVMMFHDSVLTGPLRRRRIWQLSMVLNSSQKLD